MALLFFVKKQIFSIIYNKTIEIMFWGNFIYLRMTKLPPPINF